MGYLRIVLTLTIAVLITLFTFAGVIACVKYESTLIAIGTLVFLILSVAGFIRGADKGILDL